jgi:predicted nuclease of restriction endonuclease-like (RecB) superfamily
LENILVIKLKILNWVKSVVKELADYILNKFPDLKGYSDKNLWRMRQFYETYNNNKKLSPQVRQLSWSNNLLILSKTKDIREKKFYIYLSIKERYSKRELERQIDSGIFERTILSNISKPSLVSLPFKDTYVLDFLNLPKNYSENDLKQGLTKNLKNFVLEFGKDFAFLGQEYRLSVGRFIIPSYRALDA